MAKVPPVIRALDETVVNRIAAGEVIQRPANALKELLENSLDAKSTNIQVTLKAGGLKLLQIQDNGTGIRKEDLSIVCKRFTTSKLTQFEDLSSIATFGFRGEALASISHVAHLTITTKTEQEPCAYKCTYEDGELVGAPKLCAGNQGTTITVEDLFYNVATRKKALKSPSEEYAKVADVVSKYAVHNPSVGFTLKKQGESLMDLRTHPSGSHVDNIKIIYGTKLARELLEIDFEDEVMKMKLHGFISNANYSTKKPYFLLFINHRLVDSTSLRKAIDQVYNLYLAKNTHPFLYLSLNLDPRNVDVNVHPTKHEVFFLHEDTIIEKVRGAIEAKLAGSNTSRAFYIQSKLPSQQPKPEANEGQIKDTSVAASRMVRTDHSAQKIDKFLLPSDKVVSSKDKNESEVLGVPNFKNISNGVVQRREINLTSILTLRRYIEEECSNTLREIFNKSTYVGCTKPHWLLFQSGTNLYTANLTSIMTELFYQILLYEFGNFGVIKYSEPMSVHDLILLALEQEEGKQFLAHKSPEEVATEACSLVTKRKNMLVDYFSLEINSEGNIVTIPMLLDNFMPAQEGLPMYLLLLAYEVDWTSEMECFRTFCQITAKYYGSFKYLVRTGDWKKTVEHTFYPVIKSHFLPPMNFSDNKCLLLIEDIHNLYKVFERC